MSAKLTYKQSINTLNFQLGCFEGAGPYDFPIINPYRGEIEDVPWTRIRELKRSQDPSNYGLHFFLDDYQFQVVWNNPTQYLDMLRKYKYVLAPDFSMFTDYPRALNIYNNYRKHWCCRYWQENGIHVIPVVNWVYPDSYEWCFDGDPEEAVVAVSSTGINRSTEIVKLFVDGYNEMERRLHPTKVLYFGRYLLPEMRDNVIMCHTLYERRIHMLRNEQQKKKIERNE